MYTDLMRDRETEDEVHEEIVEALQTHSGYEWSKPQRTYLNYLAMNPYLLHRSQPAVNMRLTMRNSKECKIFPSLICALTLTSSTVMQICGS